MIEFTPDELAKRDDLAAKAAEAYADYVYQKTIFEQMSKDMLASIMMKVLQEQDGKGSQAELEMKARGTLEWQAFRKAQFDLLKEAGRREIAYNNRQRRWETARSSLSFRKAEVERISG